MSNSKCPLALAAQEYFKDETISVGGVSFNNENCNIHYEFNSKLWYDRIVDAKIEEAQKCLKSKKKFNTVFLELIKQ